MCVWRINDTRVLGIFVWVGDFFSLLSNDTTKYIIIILAQSLTQWRDNILVKNGEKERKSWQQQRLVTLRGLTNKINNHTTTNRLIMLTQTNTQANHCENIPQNKWNGLLIHFECVFSSKFKHFFGYRRKKVQRLRYNWDVQLYWMMKIVLPRRYNHPNHYDRL